MICPHCDDPITDIIEHIKKCSIDPQRLINVGLLTEEEVENLNIINSNTNDKGDVSASPRLNNN